MQDEKRFLKINFDKYKVTSNFCKVDEAHVIFYSENNDLLSQVFLDDKKLAAFLKKNIIINSSNFITVRSEKGTFFLVRRKLETDEGFTDNYLEEIGGNIYNYLKSIGYKNIKIYENLTNANIRIALGILLSSYKFHNYKKITSKNNVMLDNVTFICTEAKEATNKFKEMLQIAKGVFTARDLVWQPPNILYPDSFAKECEKFKKIGIKVTVFNEVKLKKLGMDALLAVGRGSRKSSKVVVMGW